MFLQALGSRRGIGAKTHRDTAPAHGGSSSGAVGSREGLTGNKRQKTASTADADGDGCATAGGGRRGLQSPHVIDLTGMDSDTE
jgi:hypothetical protein